MLLILVVSRPAERFDVAEIVGCLIDFAIRLNTVCMAGARLYKYLYYKYLYQYILIM